MRDQAGGGSGRGGREREPEYGVVGGWKGERRGEIKRDDGRGELHEDIVAG